MADSEARKTRDVEGRHTEREDDGEPLLSLGQEAAGHRCQEEV
jgi:hypothetical protein